MDKKSLTELVGYKWEYLTRTLLENALDKYYWDGVFKITLYGPPEYLLQIRHFDNKPMMPYKSKKHKGLIYWHYITQYGVNCRMIIEKGLDDIYVVEGHIEK